MSKRLNIKLILLMLFVSSVGSCYKNDSFNTSKVEDLVEPPKDLIAEVDENNIDGAKVLSVLNRLFTVKPEIALGIAKKELKFTKENATSLKVCDGGLNWRVIDMKEMREVVVWKNNGRVYAPPTILRQNVLEETLEIKHPINEIDAFEIAKDHFKSYSRQKFNVGGDFVIDYFPSVCDLGEYWRVYFIPNELSRIERLSDTKNLSNNHPPDYLVSKKTGEIVYFSFTTKD